MTTKTTPQLGKCAFCGAPNAFHRVIDAIRDRWDAGEPLAELAHDYDMTSDEVWDIVDPERRS